MNSAKRLALFDRDQRIEIEFPGTRREVTPHVVRHVEVSGTGEGMITHSRLNEENADDAIREQMRYFEGLGQDFEWKLYDYDQPPDLKARLAAHGFTVEEEEAIMVLDLDLAPEVLWGAVRGDVRRITDPEKLADVVAIEAQVWNEDFSSLGEFLGESLRSYPDQMSVYIAYVDVQPASAAWVYFPQHSQFASLWRSSASSVLPIPIRVNGASGLDDREMPADRAVTPRA